MRGFLGTDEFVEVVAQHTRNVLYFPITHGLGTLHDPTFSDRTTVNWDKREKVWDGVYQHLKRGGCGHGELKAAISDIGQNRRDSRKFENLLEI